MNFNRSRKSLVSMNTGTESANMRKSWYVCKCLLVLLLVFDWSHLGLQDRILIHVQWSEIDHTETSPWIQNWWNLHLLFNSSSTNSVFSCPNLKPGCIHIGLQPQRCGVDASSTRIQHLWRQATASMKDRRHPSKVQESCWSSLTGTKTTKDIRKPKSQGSVRKMIQ